MKVVMPQYYILTELSYDGRNEIAAIERAARTCYKSEPKGEIGELAKRLVKNGHEAMLEHSTLSVLFICDRGVSHELVRHRMASFAQESTRWCNYSADKFNNELTFIEPIFFRKGDSSKCCHGRERWLSAMIQCEDSYMEMLELGFTPQEARSVLPNSLKTEIVVTANYREWRHILQLRCAKDAHPQMKELMIPLLVNLRGRLPEIFGDIDADWDWYPKLEGYDQVEVFPNCTHLFSEDGRNKYL